LKIDTETGKTQEIERILFPDFITKAEQPK
jgi:hypothetical protein